MKFPIENELEKSKATNAKYEIATSTSLDSGLLKLWLGSRRPHLARPKLFVELLVLYLTPN